MQTHWLLQATAALTFLPALASASIYDFKSTETSALGNPAYSFALDTSQAHDSGGVTSFTNVTIDKNGVPDAGNTVTLVSSDEVASPLFFFIDTDVPNPKPFYSGSGTTTTFNVRTFSIADGFTDGEGSLVISAATVPEPGTWLLMLVGLGGVGLMLRRAGSNGLKTPVG